MYTASKSFVTSVAEALHDEMRPTGVTVTSLMPDPTATNFFRRGGMPDTVIGRMPEDDPALVARQGYDALMSGDRKVLAASLFSTAMGVTNWFLSDSVKSAADRLMVTRTGSR
jgi:short-subunit dehydrogenase